MVPRAVMKEIAGILPLYGLGLLIAFGLKAFYSRVGAENLNWVLEPTSRLTGFLSGIRFERESGIGWISRSHRMILGSGCAGLNFMIAAFSTCFFSLVHRLKAPAARCAWLGLSLAIAYLLSVVTNSLRIIAAIHLYALDIYRGCITPERIHRAAGTMIYCSSLLLAYLTVERILQGFRVSRGERRLSPALAPLGWYLAITLGVPLADRAYRHDVGRFLEHSALVLAVCLIVALTGIALGTAKGGRGRPRQEPGRNETPMPRC